MIKYIENDSRKIRIEPNPFKQLRNKFKMRTRKTTSGGQPVVSVSGDPIYVDAVPDALYRVPGTSKRVGPGRTASNTLNTGLTILVANPYKTLNSYTLEWENVLKGKEKVLLQHVIEYECDYPLDYLTHRIKPGAIASDKEDKKFFEKIESKPKLDGGVSFLNLANPIHRVNYYTLLAHKKIANTYEDLLDGGNIEAEWFIVDEELELNEAANRNITDDTIFNAIYKYYNHDSKNFYQFMELYKLWKDPVSGRDKFVALADVFDYQHMGLISYKNGKYTWFKIIPGEPTQSFMFTGKMGFVVEFLLDPAQQENVEVLREEFENKIR